MENPSTDDINILVALFNQGRYTEGETLAKALTVHFPESGMVWKILGVMYKLLERNTEALAAMQKAAELLPGDAENLSNLGVTCQELGRFADAEVSYRQAIAMKPDYAQAYNNLGAALKAQGRLSDAEAAYQKAIDLKADYADAYNNLGNTLQAQGRFRDAEVAYRQSIAITPDCADTYKSLGNTLQAQNRSMDAEAAYRQAIAIMPDFAEAYYYLGGSLQAQGRISEAEASFKKAIAIKPDYAEAHNNLASILMGYGRFQDAEANYRRALDIKPDYAEANNNLGNLLKEQNRMTDAEACYKRAIKIKPDYYDAYCNLGNLLKEQGRLTDAEANYRRAIAINPDDATVRLAMAMMALPIAPQTIEASLAAPHEFDRALQNLFDWVNATPGHRVLFSKAVGSQQPFYLAYRDGNHVASLSRYGNLAADIPAQIQSLPCPERKKPRIIVVSHHLRRHSVWDIIIRGLLVHLDRSKFEIFLYKVCHDEDGETAFARSLADGWRDLNTIESYQGWLDAIAADQPDVIFYPEIGMDCLTLRLASRRLAPLQIASWGHPITTGLPTIDLYFSGDMLEPPDADAHYRERLVRLPGTGCCTTPIDVVSEALPELEAELALRSGARFVIPQVSVKFDPGDDGLYADIAATIGESTFIVLRDSKFPWATNQVIDRLGRAFSARGLDPQKHLLFIPWLPREKFYGLLDLCDVYLDCPSFSGYTTAWQAIHRGLPVVTREGKYMRQRMAAGLLRKIGATDTIATSMEHYVSIAKRLAEECRDPKRRDARRQALKTAALQADQDVNVVRSFEQSVIDALAERGRKFEF